MENPSKLALIALLTIVIIFIGSCYSQAAAPIPTLSPAAPPTPASQPTINLPPAPPAEFKLDLVATAPPSYQLDVAPVYSGHGFCYLGSLTMLFKYDDPTIEFSDVTAYSDVGSSGIFNPKKTIGIPFEHVAVTEGASWAVMVHTPRNLGYSLIVSAAKGGRIDSTQIFQGIPQFIIDKMTRIKKEAKSINYFDTEDDSFNFLKKVIASGYPVEVHLNTIRVMNDFAKANNKWAENSEKWRQHNLATMGHMMVVTGYDTEHVYLNDPTEPDNPINLPATIANFKAAWNTPEIMYPPENAGPYWMLFVKKTGEIKSASDIITWNKQRSANTPQDIRRFSENLRLNFKDMNVILGIYQFGETRIEYARFLRKNGKTEAAALYEQSGKLWVGLITSSTPSFDLKKIADLEEKAQSLY